MERMAAREVVYAAAGDPSHDNNITGSVRRGHATPAEKEGPFAKGRMSPKVFGCKRSAPQAFLFSKLLEFNENQTSSFGKVLH